MACPKQGVNDMLQWKKEAYLYPKISTELNSMMEKRCLQLKNIFYSTKIQKKYSQYWFAYLQQSLCLDWEHMLDGQGLQEA